MLGNGHTDIIGGMFGLAEPFASDHSAPPFISDRTVLLANARSGIAVLIEKLSPRRIWMPSYFCEHILKTVGENRPNVWFYEVDFDLKCTSREWVSAVRDNDLVVVADYFGFLSDPVFKQKLKEQGAQILEDASQALLTENIGQFADFVLFSPRKFLGVPDGGLLVCKSEFPTEKLQLESAPPAWWLKAFAASLQRREFDRHGGDRRWFGLFQDAERTAPVGPYAMSELSRMLLLNSFNYVDIAAKRIKNYQQLASELGRLAMFQSLPPGVVPLGFPIRIRQRDRVRQALFSHKIYPPVHWPIQGVVPETFMDSHRLSAEIMTLPCDQRYGQADMERIIAVVKQQLSH